MSHLKACLSRGVPIKIMPHNSLGKHIYMYLYLGFSEGFRYFFTDLKSTKDETIHHFSYSPKPDVAKILISIQHAHSFMLSNGRPQTESSNHEPFSIDTYVPNNPV